MTGRLSAGGGTLDLVTALLAMRDPVLPPTINVTSLTPGCEIDLVTWRSAGEAGPDGARPRPGPGRLQRRRCPHQRQLTAATAR
jgi:hypothetical protein